MSECQLTEGTWGGHPHFRCRACNIATLDEAAARRRCQLTSPAPAAVTSERILGPDGDPAVLEPRHVGGGWWELPNGQRVQGREEAVRAMNPEPETHDL